MVTPVENGGKQSARAEVMVAEAVGRLIAFWGFRNVMGRAWAVLYLSEAPLSAEEICGKLGISRGAASMALADLEAWGVVLRLREPGRRRELFAAETDIWKMISRVLRGRELREIETALAAFSAAAEAFDVQALVGGIQERRAARFASRRTASLVKLAKLGRGTIRLLVETGSADLTSLRRWGREAEED